MVVTRENAKRYVIVHGNERTGNGPVYKLIFKDNRFIFPLVCFCSSCCLFSWQTDKNTNTVCINQDITAAILEQYHYSLIVSVTAGFPALHQT